MGEGFRKVWTPLCHGMSDSDSAQTWQEDRSLGSLAAILECDLKAQEQTSRNKDHFCPPPSSLEQVYELVREEKNREVGCNVKGFCVRMGVGGERSGVYHWH